MIYHLKIYNNDCLFNTLLYCNLKELVTCLVIDKNTSEVDSEYFWRVIYKMTNAKINFSSLNYYNKCIIYHNIYNLMDVYILNDCTETQIYNKHIINVLRPMKLSFYKHICFLVNITIFGTSFGGTITIPSEITHLVNLKQLSLSQNKILVIPTQIGKLINLQSLYLSANVLQFIPTEIGKLINLRELSLV